MLNIAHRGASAYAPENTLSAFRRAMEMGADGVELDIHVCATGELMVIHDETVNRTTNGKGKVAEMSLAALKELRIARDETIPTLDEVFEALGPKPYYFLECKKADAMEGTAKLMLEKIQSGWDAGKLTLISFVHDALAATKTNFPAIAIGASFEKLQGDALARARALGAHIVLPKYTMLTPLFCHEALAQNMQVITWTVNVRRDITRVRALGVAGIMSDYPDRLD